jgi:hypothetical protein
MFLLIQNFVLTIFPVYQTIFRSCYNFFYIERAGELRILYIREEKKPYKRGDVAELISQRPT